MNSKSYLAELANASPMTLLRGDLGIIAVNVQKAQKALEAATGGRQSWLDPVVAIANARANEPLPEGAKLERLEAENAKLKEALFGKLGVSSGLGIIEKCHAVALKAEHGSAPFPLDAGQAKLWHQAQAAAYGHALEMISIDSSLQKTASKVISDQQVAAAVAVRLALAGEPFAFSKIDGGFQLAVEEGREHLLDNLPVEKFALIQEGGSSGEHYVHVHESEDDAEADRVSCADDGAYRTSPIVTISPVLAALGESFYETVERMVSASNDLECVDVPKRPSI